MKTCKQCLVPKPPNEFYTTKNTRDGLNGKCKMCFSANCKQYRIAHLDEYRAYEKTRANDAERVAMRAEYVKTDAGKAAVRRSQLKWEGEHPERKVAARVVSNAVRDGKLSKLPCLICGNLVVEAHHPDYSRPLDVVWLCVPHHKATHRMVKEIA